MKGDKTSILDLAAQLAVSDDVLICWLKDLSTEAQGKALVFVGLGSSSSWFELGYAS